MHLFNVGMGDDPYELTSIILLLLDQEFPLKGIYDLTLLAEGPAMEFASMSSRLPISLPAGLTDAC